MKKLFSFIVSTLLFQFALAQQEVYKIDYSIAVDPAFKGNIEEIQPDDPETTDLFRAVLEAMEGETVLEAWVGKTENKIKSNLFQQWVYLRNTEEKTLFRIDTNTLRFSRIPYIPQNAPEYPVNLDSKETTTIAGYPCKLAVIEIGPEENGQVEIWYTEKIPQIFWGEYQYLSQVPGAALKISTLGVAFIAQDISTVQVPDQYFKVPKNYSLVEDFDHILDDKFEDIELGEDLIAYYDSTSFLYGLKSTDGNIISKPNFLSISAFNNGTAVAVDESGTSALIDNKGKNITEYIYDMIAYDSELNAYIYSKEGKMSVMDDKGNTTWTSEFDTVNPFSSDYTIVTLKDKSGLVDKKGKIVVPITYKNLYINNNRYFVVDNDVQSEIYEIQGEKLVLDGYKFLFITEIDGIFVASKDAETFGLLNSKGEIILPFEYSYITVSDGVATVLKNGEDQEQTINLQVDDKK
ncbi:WG repeat-containing protein [Sphingobacterium sp.]|uniref:WG repeat-containing protein n=1 Tax=Sphingobacterium sp. TaxID=341027 RepID=UPI0028AD6C68|nr:WG repeat-containing protein [Sphingobacterium sp.]